MVTYRAVTDVTSKFAFLEHIQSIYREMVSGGAGADRLVGITYLLIGPGVYTHPVS